MKPDPSAAPQRPTNVRYVVLGLLCVLSFLTYFDRICIMRAQEAIKADLSISKQQMGWIFAMFWLAYGLFEIPAGWLGDRYGPRITLVRIVLGWSLFTAMTGFATGFWSLLAARFLFGVGEAGAYPNMARVMTNWLPAHVRGRAGGLLWLVARWGGAFSPMLFGMMLQTDVRDFLSGLPGMVWLADVAPWRIAFCLAALLGVAWCAVFFPWFRDTPAEKASVNRAELDLIEAGRAPGDADGHGTAPGLWRALFRCPSLWAMGCLYLCGSFGWSFFASWAPEYLKDVHNVAYSESESLWGQPLLYGGFSCLVGGFLSDWLVRRSGRKWLGRAVFPMCGYTTAGAAMFSIRFVDTPEQAVVLMCIAAAGNDFGQGANWATIVDIGGRYPGTAAGFNNMIGNMGNVFGPIIGAFLFTVLSWDAAFVVYAGAFLTAASMWLIIDPTRPFFEPTPAPSLMEKPAKPASE